MKAIFRGQALVYVFALIVLFSPLAANAQASAPGSAPAAASSKQDPLRLSINLDGMEKPAQLSVAVQIVIVMTLLTVAPSIVLLMTSFTRIVIVLGFVRTALGVPSAPSNQIIVGLALFLTFFIMGPVFDRANKEALQPYLAQQISSNEALDKASAPPQGVHAKADAGKGVGILSRARRIRADGGKGFADACGDPGVCDQ